MIKEFVDKWNKNKDNLENYFKSVTNEEISEYEDIVKALFNKVINIYDEFYEKFNVEKMTVIDDSIYQGTKIFIIPLDTSIPNEEDYIITYNYYGSCSGCDALQSIINHNYDEIPNEEQVEGYMTLALHLLQKCKWLYNEEEVQ